MTAPSLDAFRFVAGNVSRETFDDVVAFEAAFQKWAARINLIAPATLGEIWQRHIMDSAQLMRLAPDATKWLDLGSGGGFPGAVIAILLRDRPGASIDLVESNNKKAAFLRTVLAQLQIPARVHVERIEDAGIEVPQIVTARALAPLPKLLGMAERWLSAGARGLFHKGRDYAAEVKESSAAWTYDLVEHRSVIDSDSVILAISNLRRR